MLLHIPHINYSALESPFPWQGISICLMVLIGAIAIVLFMYGYTERSASVRYSSAPVKGFGTTKRTRKIKTNPTLLQTAEAIKTIAESNGLPVSTVLHIVEYLAAIAASKTKKH
jgi:hypothetical protein